jgi:hypothetical protein
MEEIMVVTMHLPGLLEALEDMEDLERLLVEGMEQQHLVLDMEEEE